MSTFAGRRSASKLAILLAMSVSEQMPLADVKNRLSEVVDRRRLVTVIAIEHRSDIYRPRPL